MPANAQPTRPNYSVKNAETVAAGKDLRYVSSCSHRVTLFLGIFTVQSPTCFSF